jgi:hypothetical protein
MFSFARRALLCLAAAAVKAQDELAALGLDGNLASQESPDIRAKENIRYELTQPQNTLTPTGLLMEGRAGTGHFPSGRSTGDSGQSRLHELSWDDFRAVPMAWSLRASHYEPGQPGRLPSGSIQNLGHRV